MGVTVLQPPEPGILVNCEDQIFIGKLTDVLNRNDIKLQRKDGLFYLGLHFHDEAANSNGWIWLLGRRVEVISEQGSCVWYGFRTEKLRRLTVLKVQSFLHDSAQLRREHRYDLPAQRPL